jgi:hypothetical protein
MELTGDEVVHEVDPDDLHGRSTPVSSMVVTKV